MLHESPTDCASLISTIFSDDDDGNDDDDGDVNDDTVKGGV